MALLNREASWFFQFLSNFFNNFNGKKKFPPLLMRTLCLDCEKQSMELTLY